MISIIIPTRNRPELLSNLLEYISEIVTKKDRIIVVDSSDFNLRIKKFPNRIPITFIYTSVKSAAIQRNIGIEQLSNEELVFFLDDDVFPKNNYFDLLTNNLMIDDVVGVSGVAISSKQKEKRKKPHGISGFVHRLFLLDSKKDGRLLKSGINIPVRTKESKLLETQWLIGCSAWKVNKLLDTRFEEDFKGQSLAEDVIFSVRMREKGKLLVNPNVELLHYESEIERPKPEEFWRMWVINRWRLIKVMKSGPLGAVAYWWANLGQFLILSFVTVRRNRLNWSPMKGLLVGVWDLIRKVK
jgi:glycosyltransferase involved in cell wall biosynthesis